MESLGGPSALLSNLLSAISLILKMGCFGVPFIDLVRDGIEGHNPLHEWSGDSGGEEADEDVMICDAGVGGVALEGRDVTLERRGVLPVLLCHVMGG